MICRGPFWVGLPIRWEMAIYSGWRGGWILITSQTCKWPHPCRHGQDSLLYQRSWGYRDDRVALSHQVWLFVHLVFFSWLISLSLSSITFLRERVWRYTSADIWSASSSWKGVNTFSEHLLDTWALTGLNKMQSKLLLRHIFRHLQRIIWCHSGSVSSRNGHVCPCYSITRAGSWYDK